MVHVAESLYRMMNRYKGHTRFPWKADNNLGCKTIKGNKSGGHRQAQYLTDIAYTVGLENEDEDRANANLLADACMLPDLIANIETLKKAIKQLIPEAITARLDISALMDEESYYSYSILEDDIERLDMAIKAAKQALEETQS